MRNARVTAWFSLLTVAALVWGAYWAGRADWNAVGGAGILWGAVGLAEASERLLAARRASRRHRAWRHEPGMLYDQERL